MNLVEEKVKRQHAGRVTLTIPQRLASVVVVFAVDPCASKCIGTLTRPRSITGLLTPITCRAHPFLLFFFLSPRGLDPRASNTHNFPWMKKKKEKLE